MYRILILFLNRLIIIEKGYILIFYLSYRNNYAIHFLIMEYLLLFMSNFIVWKIIIIIDFCSVVPLVSTF